MAKEDLLAQKLLQLEQKENPPPADDNTLLQKMLAPNDSAQLSDNAPTLAKARPSTFVWGGTGTPAGWVYGQGQYSLQSVQTFSNWTACTLSNVDAITRPGSIILAKNGSNYYTNGTATTPAIDLGAFAASLNSLTVRWNDNNTSAAVSDSVQIRFSGNGTAWGSWQGVTNGQVLTTGLARYVQLQVTLTTTNTAQTPQVNAITLLTA